MIIMPIQALVIQQKLERPAGDVVRRRRIQLRALPPLVAQGRPDRLRSGQLHVGHLAARARVGSARHPERRLNTVRYGLATIVAYRDELSKR